MKISIDNIENKKDYLDEVYYIYYKYKAFYNNPKKRVYKQTSNLISRTVFMFIYLVIVVILAIKSKDMSNNSNTLFYICIGIAITTLSILLARFIRLKKYLNANNDNVSNSVLEINSEKVTLNNKVVKQETTMDINDIKKILITKRCIFFMSKYDGIHQNTAISVPRTVELKVLDALKKYDKENLVIYNEN